MRVSDGEFKCRLLGVVTDR